MIDIYNLTKEYGKQKILDNITITIHKHDFVVIYGESGCGKTTFLQMIAGLIKPTHGKISIHQRELDEEAIQELLANEMSYVFQDHRLLNELNVKENILSGIDFSNKEVDLEWFELICNDLKINELLNKQIHQISAGQRQRVAVARALIKKPSILLLDEPTGNLDKQNTHFLLDFLKKLYLQTDITILFVTHELSIKDYGNRIFYIENKTIREEIKSDVFNEGKRLKIRETKRNKFLTSLSYVERYTKKHLFYYLFISLCISIACISFFLSVNIGSNFKEYLYFMASNQQESCVIDLLSTHESGKMEVSDLREIEDMEHVLSMDYNMHLSYGYERDENHYMKINYNHGSISDEDKVIDFFGMKLLSTLLLGDSDIQDNEIMIDENIVRDLKLEDPIGKEIKIRVPICLYYEKRNMSDSSSNEVDQYARYTPVNENIELAFIVKGVIQSDFPENYTIIHDRTYLESKVEELAKKNLDHHQFTSVSSSTASIIIDDINHLSNVIEEIENNYEIMCSNMVLSLLESIENIEKVQSIYSIGNFIILVSIISVIYVIVRMNYSKKQIFLATLEYLGASKRDILLFIFIELGYMFFSVVLMTLILVYILLPYLNVLLSNNNPIISFTQIYIQQELALFTIDFYQISLSLMIAGILIGFIQFISFIQHKRKPLIETLKWEVR